MLLFHFFRSAASRCAATLGAPRANTVARTAASAGGEISAVSRGYAVLGRCPDPGGRSAVEWCAAMPVAPGSRPRTAVFAYHDGGEHHMTNPKRLVASGARPGGVPQSCRRAGCAARRFRGDPRGRAAATPPCAPPVRRYHPSTALARGHAAPAGVQWHPSTR